MAKPKQVCLMDCGTVVSGSHHGIIYIFDRKSGETVDELTIEPHKVFQTVAVRRPCLDVEIYTESISEHTGWWYNTHFHRQVQGRH